MKYGQIQSQCAGLGNRVIFKISSGFFSRWKKIGMWFVLLLVKISYCFKIAGDSRTASSVLHWNALLAHRVADTEGWSSCAWGSVPSPVAPHLGRDGFRSWGSGDRDWQDAARVGPPGPRSLRARPASVREKRVCTGIARARRAEVATTYWTAGRGAPLVQPAGAARPLHAAGVPGSGRRGPSVRAAGADWPSGRSGWAWPLPCCGRRRLHEDLEPLSPPPAVAGAAIPWTAGGLRRACSVIELVV